MLQEGYAVGSINVRLSTIKTYARLAAKAGIIDPTEYALIKAVDGYSYKEKPHLDEKREVAGLATRIGKKKKQAVSITPAQADHLKNDQPDTPQGRRDALLMCLLLDHGLRCGEVAALDVKAIDLKRNKLTFYRAKVSIEQTHTLSADTIQAAQAYFSQANVPTTGQLLHGSRKDGTLTSTGMSERAITKRVTVLGEKVGVENLSAHDCRHFWATDAAESGTVMSVLMQAGGWASPAMPARYIKAAEIANEGIRQGAKR
jgi:integrase